MLGRRRGVARGDQQQPDDADRLLRVVAAVAEAVEPGRDQLQAAEPVVDLAAARRARKMLATSTISSAPSRKPSTGETKMKSTVFPMPAAIERAGAGLGDHRADDAADQRVRRARRNAEPPGDEVPDDRADQRAEDDVMVDDAGLDDALADRRRDAEVEDEDRDDVEEGGEDDRLLRLEHAGRDDGGDRVGGVVEAVHEVERDRQHDQHRDDAERDLGSCHRRERAQEFSRTTPSIRLATSSQRSEIDSSSS